jgi:hypothetical protein
MGYSSNLLPKSAAYYILNNATIENNELSLGAGGFIEISLSKQLLPKLTKTMLVVVHPSIFTSGYSNEAVQVTISIITASGRHINYLIPVSHSKTGVFNTVLNLPEEEYTMFNYRLSSNVPVTVYNWELCSEEDVDISVVIGGVEQALPRLLYDYNTYAYAVAQKEVTVGLITCFLRQATDLQGHFTLSFFATERCNVHVRIKDNGITELYTPQVYTIERGYASISIPHAYLKKLATNHNFSVTLQCTNGQLSIPVRGLLYTIDGGYLATRLLDAGIDIIDISIRQLPSDQSPSEIWALGFEGNRIILKKANYDMSSGIMWEAVHDFGEGFGGVIEFKGLWTNRDRAANYTLETLELPYVSIIDTENNLYTYYGNTFEDKQFIDDNVSAVAMCQGFNSMIYPEQDQGLILTYIKNGCAYYRQLLREETIWQGFGTLYDAGDASDISIHRLPDYRVGICITHTTGVKWYITDRTYVGQSVKTQYYDVDCDDRNIITVIGTDRVNEVVDTPTIETLTPEERTHKQLLLTFSNPLGYIWNASPAKLIKTLRIKINNVLIEPESVIIGNKTILITFAEAFAGGLLVEVSAVCPGVVLLLYNGCRTSANINVSFTPPLPIKTYEVIQPTEAYNIKITKVTGGPIVKEIITTPQNISELPLFNAAPVLNMTVEKVTERSFVTNVDSEFDVSPVVSLNVLQTGVSPV